MKTNINIKAFGAIAGACFVVTASSAAQDNITTHDVLELINPGSSKEQPAKAPVPAQPEVAEPVIEEVVVSEVAEPVIEEVVVPEVEEVLAPVDEPVFVEEIEAPVLAEEEAVLAPLVMDEPEEAVLAPVVMDEPEAELEVVEQEVAPVVEPVVAEEVVADPIDRVLTAIEASDERSEDLDAILAEEVVEEEDLDAVGMTDYNDSSASTEGELISVRLDKVSLEDAIALFAQLSGANIIVPELTDVSRISVNLQDVEWRPALQTILATYDYELYQRVSGSNVFSVRRRPPGAPDPLVVETFKLKYATVPNAMALIKTLLPENAKISAFASRNMLVVKSSESSLSEIRSVLDAIDVVRQQVFIESKFMELNDAAQKDLGIDWKQLGLAEDGTGGLGASIGESTQTYNDGRQLTDLGETDATIALPMGNFSDHLFTSVLNVEEFGLVLNALEADRGVNVVSNPKLIVANEEAANITIVRKEPNLKQEREQQQNDQPAIVTYTMDTETPFFEYGITLDVVPSINTSSNITVKIVPSLTRKYADKLAGDTTYPIIDEKKVSTVFNLASGETAAIGGLTEITDEEITRKVPLLGSIPFLGRLFSWEQTISDQTETIIFVTVGLANTQDIDLENSLPEDSELARRRLIQQRNEKILRERSRKYYEDEKADSLSDGLAVLDQAEVDRLLEREERIAKENK